MVSIAAALVLNALNSNIALYVTPSEVAAGKSPKGQAFRIGGMVKDGSVRRDNLTVHFVVTDTAKDIPVSYTGILPDLFKEGKGAVVQGRLGPDGQLHRVRGAGQARRELHAARGAARGGPGAARPRSSPSHDP